MSITSRMFEGNADLLRMRDFLIAANASGRPGYWHIGDLIWGIYQNTIFDPRASIRLWEDAGGELLGFAWREERRSAPTAPLISRGLGFGPMKRFRRWRRNQPLPAKRQVTSSQGSTDEVSTY